MPDKLRGYHIAWLTYPWYAPLTSAKAWGTLCTSQNPVLPSVDRPTTPFVCPYFSLFGPGHTASRPHRDSGSGTAQHRDTTAEPHVQRRIVDAGGTTAW